MSRFSLLVLGLVISQFLTLSASGQVPLTEAEVEKINPVFDAPSNSLKCMIVKVKPALDFAARFKTGYLVNCRLGVFEGQAADIFAYARVTPAGKPPTVLEEDWHFPAPDPGMLNGEDPRKLKTDLELSGAFGVGEGDYSVEVLVVDNRNRTCFKRWQIHVRPNRTQRKVPFAINPLTVESLEPKWDIAAQPRGQGIRVTVLLNAAATNPYNSGLHAEDRSLLLESLYSLIRQIPSKSVRVVAFNLDQQQEIFRQDNFDGEGFTNLWQTLSELETATISVQELRERDSPRFLVGLASKEASAADISDVVIFLGPHSHLEANISRGTVTGRKDGKPRFFYFEYYPRAGEILTDAIQDLTKSLGGRVFLFHSPAELGRAIQKMLTRLKQD